MFLSEKDNMGKKILIMDDEEAFCKEMAAFLTDLGYDAHYVLDGKQGMAFIEKNLPNLLLLDIQMPEMDGLQVLNELAVRFPNLVVVVISGFLDSELTAKVIEHGAALCMDKPFKLEDLSERVIKPLIGGPHD